MSLTSNQLKSLDPDVKDYLEIVKSERNALYEKVRKANDGKEIAERQVRDLDKIIIGLKRRIAELESTHAPDNTPHIQIPDDGHLRAVAALRAKFGWHGDDDDEMVRIVRKSLQQGGS